jgi:site-specific recombinase XerD
MPKKARPEMSWIESRNCWRKKKTIGGEQHVVEGKTQDEVRSKLDALERLHDSGVILGDETTLQQFAKEWFPVKTAGLKPKSASVYENAINVHIAPYFKDMKLADIRTLNVKRFMASKSEYSKSMQTKILMTLNQMMEEAAEAGLIAKNPCKSVKAKGYKARKKTPLTKAQQSELSGIVKGKRCELFTLLCLYAGLRREEALGLMWSSVHLGESPYIDVRHTVTFDKGRPIHSPDLKSDAAYRSIPIPVILAEALKGAKKEATSVMVVPAENTGGAMSETAFNRMWDIVTGYRGNVVKRDERGKTVKDESGKPLMTKKHYPGSVGFKVEPHLLRHTYITELCASGMDIKKIQYLAGHEDIRMTLEIYTHVTQNKPEDLSPKINEIFAS